MKIKVLVLSFMLSACTHLPSKQARVKVYSFPQSPLSQAAKGQQFFLGGFSGLTLLKQENGLLEFLTHTDRGPNGESIAYLSGVGRDVRPFALPKFNPLWVQFQIQEDSSEIKILKTIALTNAQSSPLTGLPPPVEKPYSNEIPINQKGEKLSFDPSGVDLEAIDRSTDGHFWMSDEYWPSILEFNAEGSLIHHYVPKHGKAKLTPWMKPTLPEHYAQRRQNRGFEGLASQNGKIYAILQSPTLEISAESKKQIHMLEFDPTLEKVTREFIYPLTDENADKIGDLASIGNGRFLVLEQNSEVGPNSYHKIFEININSSSQILQKKLILDLVQIGFDFADKIEGLAIIDNKHIAIINDNDFQLNGKLNLDSGQFGIDASKKSFVGIITLENPL